MTDLKIRGVLPPMITPFKTGGQLDLDAHLNNIERWNATDLRGLVVLGSNSETAYLNESEKLQLIELTAKAKGKDKLLLAGTGMESTRETIRLTNRAAERGAQGALLLTPFYYANQMGDAALIKHYERIANESEIPIFIYNVPKFTHLNLSAELVENLSQHPNIAGMKDSTGSIAQLVEFQRVAQTDFHLMVGTASVWYPALCLGVRAAIMALANCLPLECAEVQHLYDLGEYGAAEILYRRLYPINKAVTATYGVAGLKYACNLMGYSGGSVRPPLGELPREGQQAIRRILVEAEMLS